MSLKEKANTVEDIYHELDLLLRMVNSALNAEKTAAGFTIFVFMMHNALEEIVGYLRETVIE